jgi:hypothetical protein
MISSVLNVFVENSRICYKPGEYIAIDEWSFPTKVGCRITQYMPGKQNKFGIKFWLASNVNNKYMVNGFANHDKVKTRPVSVFLLTYVGRNLVESYSK